MLMYFWAVDCPSYLYSFGSSFPNFVLIFLTHQCNIWVKVKIRISSSMDNTDLKLKKKKTKLCPLVSSLLDDLI